MCTSGPLWKAWLWETYCIVCSTDMKGNLRKKAANCKELLKDVHEECGPLQIKDLLDLANQVFEN